MGFFGSIGKALKKVAKVAAPVIGGIVGGPLGGVAGGAISKLLNKGGISAPDLGLLTESGQRQAAGGDSYVDILKRLGGGGGGGGGIGGFLGGVWDKIKDVGGKVGLGKPGGLDAKHLLYGGAGLLGLKAARDAASKRDKYLQEAVGRNRSEYEAGVGNRAAARQMLSERLGGRGPAGPDMSGLRDTANPFRSNFSFSLQPPGGGGGGMASGSAAAGPPRGVSGAMSGVMNMLNNTKATSGPAGPAPSGVSGAMGKVMEMLKKTKKSGGLSAPARM